MSVVISLLLSIGVYAIATGVNEDRLSRIFLGAVALGTVASLVA